MTLIHGFETIEERFVTELNIDAKVYRHAKTGAELLSIVAEDENKAFNITFRTPPSDSTGVAHILEHSVLCGSRKYRSKEPFIELVKGSLKTFVNAMTGGDATFYPVASTNLQDFYNLVDVYLDAVFHPLLTQHAFHQEGWRYELEKAEDELTYKGIVFNEMKGYYASPDLHLNDRAQQTLQPDTIYAYDSGGEPSRIPDLRYDDFLAFHKRFYHPSNARILFYGDDPPLRRLELLDGWLSEFEPVKIDSSIALQPRFTQPRSYVFPYPAGDEGASQPKSHMVISWLIEGGLDPFTSLAHEILAYALIRSSASPLRKTLLDSDLGEEVFGGLNDGPQMIFQAGLKGVAHENCAKVETLILDTLTTLANDGIDPETIAAALNTTEFALRENNTGSFPKGLSIGFRALALWLYDANPLDNLSFEAPLEAVKEAAKDPRFFADLIRESIVDNAHRVTVVVEPDIEFSERQNRVERERLDAERAAMTPIQISEIIAETHTLRQLQETPDSPEALAAIPTLTLADMEPKTKTTPTEERPIGEAMLSYHDIATSGIVYLDLAFDLHNVPFDLLPYVPLLGSALTQLGAADDDSVRLIQRIGQKTGGVWATPFVSPVYGEMGAAARLIVRSKALPSQASDQLSILNDIVTGVRLENRERLRQMVLERKAYYESSLASSASRFVGERLRSRFGEAGAASAKMSGVEAYFFIRDLVKRIDSDWDGVEADLRKILALLVNQASTVVNVTLDSKHWSKFEPLLTDFVKALPSAKPMPELWKSDGGPQFEGMTVPTQVNAVGKAANLYELGYARNGSTAVITNYVRTTWLWEQVRMRGGAYGANCGFDPRSGILNFSSSQDPSIIGTLNTYDKTADFLRTVSLSDLDRTRTIIGVISDLDSYELPDAKGYSAMLRGLIGETDERRQLVREQVLATTEQSFRDFADVLDAAKDKASVVVMGSAKAIEEAAKTLSMVVTPVL